MISIIRSDKSWIESEAVEQLEKLSQLKGMVRAVGMPDLHPGKTPVGAAFITEKYIYPHIAGNDIGCGMALFTADVNKKKFKIDKTIKALEKLENLQEVYIDYEEGLDNFLYKDKLGTIGGGNHFAEFQEINQVFDEEALDNIGIDKSNVLLLVHSGSRNFGEYILQKHLSQYDSQNGLEEGSNSFNAYISDHAAAVEYARINREMVACRIFKHLNIASYTKALDSVHNSITVRTIAGVKYYIHRKGAAPADVNYVVVAGSRGSKSYIVKPIADSEKYGFSISHGAGRKWPRSSCKERLESVYSKKNIKNKQMQFNLICADKKLIYEEAPEAYKDIDKVMEDMLKENMVKVIASLNPMITYKG